ncbi:MAG: PHP domain-containing protein [Oscillospiraceae bacterium]|jgi:predicted metal-dependent phosphoesterase TrpH|nr:PHP domain-containing protein [Oscillospiraceae bacterium]
MPADLHCHTKISDGSTSIDELVILAKNSGLTAVGITDHDTFAGANRAKVLGARQGVKVIPGIELSCYDYKRGRKVHLLGYMCCRPDKLVGLCKRTSDARKKAMQQKLAKVIRQYPITVDMVTKIAVGSTNVFKQHVMHALLNCGYDNVIFGELHDSLFGENGSCNSATQYPDIMEVLPLLLDSGTVTVLAHPYTYDSLDIIPELCEKGLHGIEVWYPGTTEEQTENLIKIADKYQLLKTGGTDFHGMYGGEARTIGTCTMPDTELEKLISIGEKIEKAMS